MKTTIFLGWIVASTALAAETPSPFSSSFEPGDGTALGQPPPGWSSNANVEVVSNAAASGSQSVRIRASDGAVLARDFGPAGAPELYVDLKIRPAAGSNLESGSFIELGVSGLGFLRSASGLTVVAFDGNAQESGRWVSIPVASPPDDWLRVTLRHDIAARRWDLFLNGAIVRSGLGYFGAPSATLNVGLFGGSSGDTWIDDFSVSPLPPAGLVFCGDTGKMTAAKSESTGTSVDAIGLNAPRETLSGAAAPAPASGRNDSSAAAAQARGQKLKVKLTIYSVLD